MDRRAYLHQCRHRDVMTLAAIGQTMGITRQRVHQLLKKFGLATQRPHTLGPYHDDEIATWLRPQVACCRSNAEIAADAGPGVTALQVYYALRRTGISVARRKLVRRFWDKVDEHADADYLFDTNHCWLWAGSRNPDGYGRFHLGGKKMLAHRMMWTLLHGSIPAGMCVLHHCDTPGCVRPSHLFLGTIADNNKDCVRKGRSYHQQHRLGGVTCTRV